MSVSMLLQCMWKQLWKNPIANNDMPLPGEVYLSDVYDFRQFYLSMSLILYSTRSVTIWAALL